MGEVQNSTLSVLISPLEAEKAEEKDEEKDEQQFYAHLREEIRGATEDLVANTPEASTSGDSWEQASAVISRTRPIPKAVWGILRAVFSQPGVIREAHPGVFFALDRLLRYAVSQKPFDMAKGQTDLRQIVTSLGVDVCAALSFIHAVSRRIATELPESLWRPIVQQALRRTLIGYYLGANSETFGRGRCMAAGFIGHAVLGIGCIGASEVQIKEAQLSLKKEGKLGELVQSLVCCDILQLVSIILAVAGFGKEAALGIGSFKQEKDEVVPGTEEYRWRCALHLSEKITFGAIEKVSLDEWEALGLKEEEKRDQLEEKLKNLDRKGFDLMWLTWPQSFMSI